MDTKTLVVGQKIWMRSGELFKEATVLEITEEYVEAKPIVFGESERPWMIRFDRNGKQRTPSRHGNGFNSYVWLEVKGFYTGWWQEHPGLLCTEFGPWELVAEIPTQSKSTE